MRVSYLGLDMEIIGYMDKPLCLLLYRNDYLWMAMSEAIDRDPSQKIKVFFPVRTPDLHPSALSDGNGKSVIRVHQVIG